MRRMGRAQVQQMWALWKQGRTLRSMSEALAVPAHTIYWLVVRAGGLAPAPRRRAARVLSLVEREAISRGLVGRQSIRAMARQLGGDRITGFGRLLEQMPAEKK